MSDMNNFQVGIIGGGPAGYTAAEAAAKAGLSVILFEKDNLGGVCLNEGCIPTKTLLYSAKVKDMAYSAAKYGVECAGASADMKKIMSRKSKIIRKLVLGIKARLTAHNVQICSGSAYIIDKENVRCNDTESCRPSDFMHRKPDSHTAYQRFGRNKLLDTQGSSRLQRTATKHRYYWRWCNRYGVRIVLHQHGNKSHRHRDG